MLVLSLECQILGLLALKHKSLALQQIFVIVSSESLDAFFSYVTHVRLFTLYSFRDYLFCLTYLSVSVDTATSGTHEWHSAGNISVQFECCLSTVALESHSGTTYYEQ